MSVVVGAVEDRTDVVEMATGEITAILVEARRCRKTLTIFYGEKGRVSRHGVSVISKQEDNSRFCLTESLRLYLNDGEWRCREAIKGTECGLVIAVKITR